MQHIFIINPNAGKTESTKWISKQVNHLFMNNTIEGTYRIEITKRQRDATAIARKYAKSGEQVTLYACGGDGTLNEVLNGCMNYQNVTLAHIPVGTGNDFIKFFGPNAKEDFLNIKELMKGNVVDIDVIDVNGTYSLNIANTGLDAMIASNVQKFKRLPFVSGKKSYQMSLAYSFFTSTKNKMHVIVDGVEEQETSYTFVVCANAKYYGGSYCAAPFANLQDGLLEVVLIPEISRPKILQLMNIYQQGKHLNGEYNDIVHYKQAKRIELKSDEPIVLCMDGEMLKLHNPIIQVANQTMKLLVPKHYTKEERLL